MKANNKRKHKLSLARRLEVAELVRKGESFRAAAKRYGISLATVHAICSNRNEYTNRVLQDPACASKSSLRVVPESEVNRELLNWCCHTSNASRITGAMLQMKAREIAAELGLTDFKASNGWLECFKRRHEKELEFSSREKPHSVDNSLPTAELSAKKRKHRGGGANNLKANQRASCGGSCKQPSLEDVPMVSSSEVVDAQQHGSSNCAEDIFQVAGSMSYFGDNVSFASSSHASKFRKKAMVGGLQADGAVNEDIVSASCASNAVCQQRVNLNTYEKQVQGPSYLGSSLDFGGCTAPLHLVPVSTPLNWPFNAASATLPSPLLSPVSSTRLSAELRFEAGSAAPEAPLSSNEFGGDPAFSRNELSFPVPVDCEECSAGTGTEKDRRDEEISQNHHAEHDTFSSNNCCSLAEAKIYAEQLTAFAACKAPVVLSELKTVLAALFSSKNYA